MPDPLGGLSMTWPIWIAAPLAGYLLGAVPFGLLLTRAAGAGDLRSIGSGNIGATNVLRTGRKGLALATLLLDAGKGSAAALIAYHVGGPDMMVMAALGAVIGHNWPIWLKFKGGKGVATTLGVMLAMALPVGGALAVTWIAVFAASRISSLGALVAAALAPAFAWLLPFTGYDLTGSDAQRIEISTILALFVLLRHRDNMRRLARGEEPRFGQKKETPAP